MEETSGIESIPLGLRTQLTEFFGSYVIVGFPLGKNGRPTVIPYIPTHKDFHALHSLLGVVIQRDFDPPTEVVPVKPTAGAG